MMLVQKDFILFISRDPLSTFLNGLYNSYPVPSIKTQNQAVKNRLLAPRDQKLAPRDQQLAPRDQRLQIWYLGREAV